MKDINEVLEQKELDLERVVREVAALQIAALLLADESVTRVRSPSYLAPWFLNSASFMGLWPTACATDVRPLGKLPS